MANLTKKKKINREYPKFIETADAVLTHMNNIPQTDNHEEKLRRNTPSLETLKRTSSDKSSEQSKHMQF